MTTKQSSIVFGSALLVATSVSGCIVRTEKDVVASPPPSKTVVVQQPSQRVVSYPEGRWQLYGDGSTGAPLYWAWVPAGTNPPPPPPLPRTP